MVRHSAMSRVAINSRLSHGDNKIIFGDYRTLMTKDEAKKIFALTPEIALLPLQWPSTM
jgi:hypothetical protein